MTSFIIFECLYPQCPDRKELVVSLETLNSYGVPRCETCARLMMASGIKAQEKV